MVKLTADLILLSPQFTNPLKEREIDLRGNKIVVIENLGATLDQFDTIDLSNNEIKKLEGFPPLLRLKTVILNNNRISRVGDYVAESLPNLEELILTNNNFSTLAELKPLLAVKSLQRLSLMKNRVTAQQHYRLFVIHHLPNLKLLDFQRVKQKEREQAKVLFESLAGKDMLEALEQASTTLPKATPEEEEQQKVQDAHRAKAAAYSNKIKEAITKATSLEEIQRLEAQLRAGIVPEDIENGTKEDMDTEE